MSSASRAARAETVTVITTASEGAMRTLHDRQPAILTTAAEVARWLDPAVPATQALSILDSTAAAETLAWHPVSSHVSARIASLPLGREFAI